MEIKIGGFGGQGVVMAGTILGKAAALYEEKEATLSRSFGPEARGGACSVQLVVQDERINYPFVTRPDLLVVMSQAAFIKFGPELVDGGTLIIEEDLVQIPPEDHPQRIYGIPATRIAEEMGRKIVLNIVMVGFIASMIDVIGPDSIREAIMASVPKGTEGMNIMAFERGFEYGRELLQKGEG